MSRNKILLVTGIVLIIMPFLGFPETFKTIVYIIIGALWVLISGLGHFKRRSQMITHDSE